MNHRYSTITLIILFVFAFIILFASAFTTQDLDQICDQNDNFIYRVNDVWQCGKYLHVDIDPDEPIAQFLKEDGDVFIGNRLATLAGVQIRASRNGFGLQISPSNVPLGAVNATLLNGSLNITTGIFCDYSNPFEPGHENKYIGMPEVNVSGAPFLFGYTGEIETYLNSSCVVGNIASLYEKNVTDTSGRLFFIIDHPMFVSLDGYFFSFLVGEGPDAKWEMHAENKQGDKMIHIENEDIAVDNMNTLLIDTFNNDKSGIIAIVSHMHDNGNRSAINMQLEMEANNSPNATGTFIDIEVTGATDITPYTVLQVNPNVKKYIVSGSAQDLSSAYYDNLLTVENKTKNFTDKNISDTVYEDPNTIIYLGNSINFTTINIALSVFSSKNVELDIWYCDQTGTWQNDIEFSDSTAGFQSSGTINLIDPGDRGMCNTEIDGTSLSDTTNYTYIALERTQTHPSFTYPIIRLISISGGTSAYNLWSDLLQQVPVSSPPIECKVAGGYYTDSDLSLPCFCNGVDWVQMNNFATVCS